MRGHDGTIPATSETRPVPRPPTVLGAVPATASVLALLAAAARSRGRRSSVHGELTELAAALAHTDPVRVDLRSARERVAEATADEARLRERVAAARGEVRALRGVEGADRDADAAAAGEELEAAAAALARAETARVAAEQALDRCRERAAAARDARERRLQLRDRLENRRRDARWELSAGLHGEFHRALAAVPGRDGREPGDLRNGNDHPVAYEGDHVTAALAAVRLAELDGPVRIAAAVAERFTRPPERVLGVAVRRPLPEPAPTLR
ncbi:hypothetical protein JCM17823_16580 [Halorubrum gandharaense]